MDKENKTSVKSRKYSGNKLEWLTEKRRQTLRIVNICALTAVFAGAALFMTFGKRPDISEVEKRGLEKCPEFSWESYWAGDFTEQFAKYYNDTVPERSTWKLAISRFRSMLGIKGGIQLVGDASTQFPSAPKPNKPSDSSTSEGNSEAGVPGVVVRPPTESDDEANSLPGVVVRPADSVPESTDSSSASEENPDLPVIVVRPPADD